MINFSLPDYYGKKDILFYFLDMQLYDNWLFQDNRRIDSIYGFPANLIWNGGRIIPENMSFLDLPDLIAEYHKRNIKLRHTCTNMLITESMLQDFLCNKYLKMAEKEGDSIIVYSDLLASYITKTFPKYNLIYSTTRNNNDINTINNLTSYHNMVVLNYNDNHNFQLLSSLKNPHNIEILCAETCIDNCPHRIQHYLSISSDQLGERKNFSCPFDRESHQNLYRSLSLNNAVNSSYINFLNAQYGINNFKISGRKAELPLYIENIVYYLIKPEYQNEIRLDALQRFY